MIPRIKGAKEFYKHKKGDKLTLKEAVLGKCYECNGEEESRPDCGVPSCTLYPMQARYKVRGVKSPISANNDD